MNNLLTKIKEIFGFCCCKRCWHRAYYNITISGGVGRCRSICEKHAAALMEGAVLKSVTVQNEMSIDFEEDADTCPERDWKEGGVDG